MTTLTFDTHEFIKKLKGVGFSEEQAEVMTELQKATASNTLEQARHDAEMDNTATKRDLREMELRLESKMKDTDLKIEQSKSELQRWIITVVFGVGLLQTAIVAALILKLAGTF